MDKAEVERTAELWRKLGELKALANPDGFIAAQLGQTAERRIAAIWEVLQTIQP